MIATVVKLDLQDLLSEQNRYRLLVRTGETQTIRLDAELRVEVLGIFLSTSPASFDAYKLEIERRYARVVRCLNYALIPLFKQIYQEYCQALLV